MQSDYLFDREQYDYIIERKTALTSDESLYTDHDKLAYILKNFEAIDPVLLEQIQYYHLGARKVRAAAEEEDDADGGQAGDADSDDDARAAEGAEQAKATPAEEVITTPLRIAFD